MGARSRSRGVAEPEALPSDRELAKVAIDQQLTFEPARSRESKSRNNEITRVWLWMMHLVDARAWRKNNARQNNGGSTTPTGRMAVRE